MLRTVFAIGIAGLIFAGGPELPKRHQSSRFPQLLPPTSTI